MRKLIGGKTKRRDSKVFRGKSRHSEVILVTCQADIFCLTRLGSQLNKCAKCNKCTLNGHWDMKVYRIKQMSLILSELLQLS